MAALCALFSMHPWQVALAAPLLVAVVWGSQPAHAGRRAKVRCWHSRCVSWHVLLGWESAYQDTTQTYVLTCKCPQELLACPL